MDAALATSAEAEVRSTPRPPPLDRLAEMVVHLSGCSAPLALAAVQQAASGVRNISHADRLGIVAAALVTVKRIDLRDASIRDAAMPQEMPATAAPAATRARRG